jgi:hypothetical protein
MLLGGVILLALFATIPILGILAAVVIVPYMLYKAYFSKDALFPKPWDTPKF